MAKYTVELGKLVEDDFDLGLDDYPVHRPEYREVLNALIVEHYYFREIGLETPAKFRRFLRRRMAEIMPYYNELFRTVELTIDPLANYDITTDADTTAETTAHQTGTSDGATTGTSHDASTGRVLNSLTPQTQLAGNEDYATSLADSHSEGDNTSTGTQTATTATDDTQNALTNYVQRVTGLSGMTGAQAITEYRAALINVNLLVLAELESLFMGLWTI